MLCRSEFKPPFKEVTSPQVVFHSQVAQAPPEGFRGDREGREKEW